MNPKILSVVALASACAASPAGAQANIAAERKDALATEELREAVGDITSKSSGAAGPLDSAVAAERTAIVIAAANDGGRATLQFGSRIDSEPKYDGEKKIKYFLSNSWGLALSAPFEGGADPREIANLNGLASGLSGSFKLSRGYSFGAATNLYERIASTEEALAAAASECTSVERANLREQEFGEAQIEEQLKILCKAPGFDYSGDDGTLSPEEFIDKYVPEFYDVRLASNIRSVWFSAEGSVGYADLDYINAADLSTLSVDGVQYGASLAAAFNDIPRKAAYIAGVRYESALREAEEAIVCLPAVPGVPPECVTGPPDAPQRRKSFLAYAELRKGFKIGEARFGVAPRVTRNFSTDVTGVSLPIYYLPGGDGLIGGVAVGWRDDTDDVTAGIFVGGSFELF